MEIEVELSGEQVRWIETVSARDGISREEAIKQAIAAAMKRDARAATLKAASGSWKDYGVDGVEYTRQVRAEWDHRNSGPPPESWYDDAVKTQVELTEEQFDWLVRHYESEGISREEAVERARATVRDPKPNLKFAMAATFGIWNNRGIDALEYERALE